MAKGRRVPSPVQPGERRQFAPGILADSLHPVVRQSIERLAQAGHERKGRGALFVELDDTTKTGIVSAQFYGVMEMVELQKQVPFGEMQPLAEAVRTYKPDHEFIAMILNVTPDLPGPQIWFDVFPRTAQEA